MKYGRIIIGIATQTIGYIRKHRRVNPKPAHKSDKIKANLGCGLSVTKGWINVDGSLNALFSSWPKRFHKILYRISGANQYYSCSVYCSLLEDNQFIHHDLLYGVPFTDNSVDYIFSSHFLEHLFKKDAIYLLNEAYRVLKPGGILRLSVPDLAYAISLYSSGEKNKMLDSYFFVEGKDNYYSRHKYMYHQFNNEVQRLG